MIVDAVKELLGEIVEIEQDCFSDPWSHSMFETLFRGDNKTFLACIRDGRVAGYLCFMSVIDEGELLNIAVAPDFRRQGIADALMAELERRCREKGIDYLNLEVRESNTDARALYEKHGFNAVGRRKKYYEKPAEDAILMTLELK